ncbi:hypothetical protein V8E36_007242 [Tilletia maclaganii]
MATTAGSGSSAADARIEISIVYHPASHRRLIELPPLPNQAHARDPLVNRNIPVPPTTQLAKVLRAFSRDQGLPDLDDWRMVFMPQHHTAPAAGRIVLALQLRVSQLGVRQGDRFAIIHKADGAGLPVYPPPRVGSGSTARAYTPPSTDVNPSATSPAPTSVGAAPSAQASPALPAVASFAQGPTIATTGVAAAPSQPLQGASGPSTVPEAPSAAPSQPAITQPQQSMVIPAPVLTSAPTSETAQAEQTAPPSVPQPVPSSTQLVAQEPLAVAQAAETQAPPPTPAQTGAQQNLVLPTASPAQASAPGTTAAQVHLIAEQTAPDLAPAAASTDESANAESQAQSQAQAQPPASQATATEAADEGIDGTEFIAQPTETKDQPAEPLQESNAQHPVSEQQQQSIAPVAASQGDVPASGPEQEQPAEAAPPSAPVAEPVTSAAEIASTSAPTVVHGASPSVVEDTSAKVSIETQPIEQTAGLSAQVPSDDATLRDGQSTQAAATDTAGHGAESFEQVNAQQQASLPESESAPPAAEPEVTDQPMDAASAPEAATASEQAVDSQQPKSAVQEAEDITMEDAEQAQGHTEISAAAQTVGVSEVAHAPEATAENVGQAVDMDMEDGSARLPELNGLKADSTALSSTHASAETAGDRLPHSAAATDPVAAPTTAQGEAPATTSSSAPEPAAAATSATDDQIQPSSSATAFDEMLAKMWEDSDGHESWQALAGFGASVGPAAPAEAEREQTKKGTAKVAGGSGTASAMDVDSTETAGKAGSAAQVAPHTSVPSAPQPELAAATTAAGTSAAAPSTPSVQNAAANRAQPVSTASARIPAPAVISSAPAPTHTAAAQRDQAAEYMEALVTRQLGLPSTAAPTRSAFGRFGSAKGPSSSAAQAPTSAPAPAPVPTPASATTASAQAAPGSSRDFFADELETPTQKNTPLSTPVPTAASTPATGRSGNQPFKARPKSRGGDGAEKRKNAAAKEAAQLVPTAAQPQDASDLRDERLAEMIRVKKERAEEREHEEQLLAQGYNGHHGDEEDDDDDDQIDLKRERLHADGPAPPVGSQARLLHHPKDLLPRRAPSRSESGDEERYASGKAVFSHGAGSSTKQYRNPRKRWEGEDEHGRRSRSPLELRKHPVEVRKQMTREQRELNDLIDGPIDRLPEEGPQARPRPRYTQDWSSGPGEDTDEDDSADEQTLRRREQTLAAKGIGPKSQRKRKRRRLEDGTSRTGRSGSGAPAEGPQGEEGRVHEDRMDEDPQSQQPQRPAHRQASAAESHTTQPREKSQSAAAASVEPVKAQPQPAKPEARAGAASTSAAPKKAGPAKKGKSIWPEDENEAEAKATKEIEDIINRHEYLKLHPQDNKRARSGDRKPLYEECPRIPKEFIDWREDYAQLDADELDQYVGDLLGGNLWRDDKIADRYHFKATDSQTKLARMLVLLEICLSTRATLARLLRNRGKGGGRKNVGVAPGKWPITLEHVLARTMKLRRGLELTTRDLDDAIADAVALKRRDLLDGEPDKELEEKIVAASSSQIVVRPPKATTLQQPPTPPGGWLPKPKKKTGSAAPPPTASGSAQASGSSTAAGKQRAGTHDSAGRSLSPTTVKTKMPSSKAKAETSALIGVTNHNAELKRKRQAGRLEEEEDEESEGHSESERRPLAKMKKTGKARASGGGGGEASMSPLVGLGFGAGSGSSSAAASTVQYFDEMFDEKFEGAFAPAFTEHFSQAFGDAWRSAHELGFKEMFPKHAREYWQTRQKDLATSLRRQLRVELQSDFQEIVSAQQTRLDELQEQNQHLRSDHERLQTMRDDIDDRMAALMAEFERKQKDRDRWNRKALKEEMLVELGKELRAQLRNGSGGLDGAQLQLGSADVVMEPAAAAAAVAAPAPAAIGDTSIPLGSEQNCLESRLGSASVVPSELVPADARIQAAMIGSASGGGGGAAEPPAAEAAPEEPKKRKIKKSAGPASVRKKAAAAALAEAEAEAAAAAATTAAATISTPQNSSTSAAQTSGESQMDVDGTAGQQDAPAAASVRTSKSSGSPSTGASSAFHTSFRSPGRNSANLLEIVIPTPPRATNGGVVQQSSDGEADGGGDVPASRRGQSNNGHGRAGASGTRRGPIGQLRHAATALIGAMRGSDERTNEVVDAAVGRAFGAKGQEELNAGETSGPEEEGEEAARQEREASEAY